MNVLERIEKMCQDIRRKPIPIADVIPLLQDAADEIRCMRSVLEIVRFHPDFDEGGPLAEAIDQSLAGKNVDMLDSLKKILDGIQPS